MGIVIALSICEFYAWLPKMSRALVRLAVWLLLPDDRDRYREEWHAHLDSLPNTMACLVAAVGFCIATRGINATMLITRHDAVRDRMEKMSLAIQDSMSKIRAQRFKMANARRSVQWPQPQSVTMPITRPIEASSENVRQYAGALLQALGRVLTIRETAWEVLDLRVNLACHIVENATKYYTQMMDQPKLSSTVSEMVRQKLAEDLDKANNILNEPIEAVDTLMREHDQIMAAVFASAR